MAGAEARAPAVEFVTVCRLDELLPSSARPFSISVERDGGRREFELAVYNIGGVLYASDSRCPHRQASLCEGLLAPDRVECADHGWAFSLITGEYEVNPEIRLRLYPIRVAGNSVQVGLPASRSL